MAQGLKSSSSISIKGSQHKTIDQQAKKDSLLQDGQTALVVTDVQFMMSVMMTCNM
jgi:hypothetical protein